MKDEINITKIELGKVKKAEYTKGYRAGLKRKTLDYNEAINDLSKWRQKARSLDSQVKTLGDEYRKDIFKLVLNYLLTNDGGRWELGDKRLKTHSDYVTLANYFADETVKQTKK